MCKKSCSFCRNTLEKKHSKRTVKQLTVLSLCSFRNKALKERITVFFSFFWKPLPQYCWEEKRLLTGSVSPACIVVGGQLYVHKWVGELQWHCSNASVSENSGYLLVALLLPESTKTQRTILTCLRRMKKRTGWALCLKIGAHMHTCKNCLFTTWKRRCYTDP